jgi:hypothetical protein
MNLARRQCPESCEGEMSNETQSQWNYILLLVSLIVVIRDVAVIRPRLALRSKEWTRQRTV